MIHAYYRTLEGFLASLDGGGEVWLDRTGRTKADPNNHLTINDALIQMTAFRNMGKDVMAGHCLVAAWRYRTDPQGNFVETVEGEDYAFAQARIAGLLDLLVKELKERGVVIQRAKLFLDEPPMDQRVFALSKTIVYNEAAHIFEKVLPEAV